jgi:SOS-response transcriptional repressor LexA
MSGGTIHGLDASSDTYKNTAGQSGAALFVDSYSTAEYGDGIVIAVPGSGVDLTVRGK